MKTSISTIRQAALCRGRRRHWEEWHWQAN